MEEPPQSTKEAGLSSVNNQLNYCRRFLGPERVLVTVPTMPFQSFDVFLSSIKVKPWELLNLLISSRIFTQWPAENAEKPEESIIDSHLLMPDHFVFIVAIHLEVSRNFHSIHSPKFPILIDANVTNIGNGSSRRHYIVKHPSMTSPYATCDIDDVVINKITRKPTSYPTWWKDKFNYISNAPISKFRLPPRTNEDVTINECKVEYAHLDHNKHATFSAYALFCFNALFENVERNDRPVYKTVSLKNFEEGVKSMTMIFHREANFGDSLTLESWEPGGALNKVQFYIKKTDGTLCSSVCIEFYSQMAEQRKNKL